MGTIIHVLFHSLCKRTLVKLLGLFPTLVYVNFTSHIQPNTMPSTHAGTHAAAEVAENPKVPKQTEATPSVSAHVTTMTSLSLQSLGITMMTPIPQLPVSWWLG